MVGDPFAELGLPWTATVAEIRVARRRLAFTAHPDRGGDQAAMTRLNAAFDAAIGHATGRRPLTASSAVANDGPIGRAPRPTSRRMTRRHTSSVRRAERDCPSFVIEALPVEAYEALTIVASWLGEVLVDEPPYLLEVHMTEPGPCWCRLELAPDAGASTVTLTVAGVEPGMPRPAVEAVRDVWVARLNQLGAEPPP